MQLNFVHQPIEKTNLVFVGGININNCVSGSPKSHIKIRNLPKGSWNRSCKVNATESRTAVRTPLDLESALAVNTCGKLPWEHFGRALLLKFVSWAQRTSLWCVSASFHNDFCFTGWLSPLAFIDKTIIGIVKREGKLLVYWPVPRVGGPGCHGKTGSRY